MRASCLAFILVAGGIGAAACAYAAEEGPQTQAATTEPASTQAIDPDAKWKGLMTRLGSADFKERERRRQELEKVPYDKQGELKRLADGATSAEVRAALRRRVTGRWRINWRSTRRRFRSA